MPDFVPVDQAFRDAEVRREASLDRGSPYRIVEGNPFANDCPLPECPWDGGSDRELADHLGDRHGDLTIRRRAEVLALRQGRVLRLADLRARKSVADRKRGGREARG